jgi:NTP pyrophosphatase (non-canonical NTP hydrolase)
MRVEPRAWYRRGVPEGAEEPMSETIEELERAVIAFRDARAWKQFHSTKNLALGLCVESGELAELMQWKSDQEIEGALGDPAFRERLASEIADVQTLLLMLAHGAGIAIDQAVRAKLVLNERRYPVDRAHGSHKKYDEL